MATFIEVNGNRYEASITGRLNDKDWGNRESKAIEVEMTYEEAKNIFVDDVNWNIIYEHSVPHIEINEDGEEITTTKIEEEVYDNSEYSIAGSITDHRDGTVTVKMGKPTAEELLAIFEEVL
jgi:hypothetical protein